jgi:hypothetical protein
VGASTRWLRPPAEVGQDVNAVVKEMRDAMQRLPVSRGAIQQGRYKSATAGAGCLWTTHHKVFWLIALGVQWMVTTAGVVQCCCCCEQLQVTQAWFF